MDIDVDIGYEDNSLGLNLGSLESGRIAKGDNESKQKESDMAEEKENKFNEAFKNISEISGYVASGVYNGNGEILASRASTDFNIQEVGGLAIELYKSARSIAEKMGIGVCNFVEIHTDNYIFIHSCIVPGKGAMGVLLEASGNIGLTRHQMNKEAKKLVSEFL